MIETYVICTLVLIINSAVLWFVINKKLEELLTDQATIYVNIKNRFADVDSDLETLIDNSENNAEDYPPLH